MVALVSLGIHSGARADHYDVFFLGGQSNASGRNNTGYVSQPVDAMTPYYYDTDGPAGSPTGASGWTTMGPLSNGYYGSEIEASRQLRSQGYNPAFIKVSIGGTNLHTQWESPSGSMWSKWQTTQSDALAALTANGHTYDMKAYFWMQGETDAANATHASNYAVNFNQFVTDTRSVLGEPDLPFVTALVREDGAVGRTTVADAQRAVMDGIVNGRYFSTNDFGMKSDNVHYNVDGINAMGEGFALGFESVPEPSSTIMVILGGLAFVVVRRR